MFDLDMWQWAGAVLCALMVGFTKTGVPGLGIFAVALFACIVPARVSTGILLIMLIIGDVFAVAYYRRHAVWAHLLPLIPWAIAGIVLGAFVMRKVNDDQLRRAIGGIVLAMLALNLWWNRRGAGEQPPLLGRWAAPVFGLLAGITTMLANAAGPIMILYLLAMRLPRNEFIGTGAWYFFLVNWIKVPFHVLWVGTITAQTFLFAVAFLPAILVGAVAGILVVRQIPEKTFNALAQVLAGVTALKLVIG